MDVKVRAAVAAGFEGISVSGLAAELGMSRRWIYVLRRRFEADGLAGLEEKSRRPKRSPQRMSAVVEDRIVRLRKELDDEGCDAGPATIWWHLQQRYNETPPSVASIWRALKRRGLIEPQPQKRPKSSFRRFEAGLVNEMWQIDATKWELADGTQVEIINIIDDHSRVCVGSTAVASTNGAGVFTAFVEAGEHWGFPTSVLSDNAIYFSGKRHGWEAPFETALRLLKIKTITSTPYHPTTCGKVERFHQTQKKWLAAHDPAHNLVELQTLLDRFVDYYNYQRPHRAHPSRTPAETHSTHTKTGPGTLPINEPVLVRHLSVNQDGIINTTPWRIGVGATWAGHQIILFVQGNNAAVFSQDQLLRALTIDPTRSYQPTGNPRGGPKQPRQPKPLLLPKTRDIV